MYFESIIKSLKNNKIKIYVDMDGVIADYNVIKLTDYSKKRPLFSNIKKLEEISKYSNVEIYILSVSIRTTGIKEKNDWLDKYAPFFKNKNRVIISKEENPNISYSDLKINYLKNVTRDNCKLMLIDDDPNILKAVYNEIDDIVLLQDSSLID